MRKIKIHPRWDPKYLLLRGQTGVYKLVHVQLTSLIEIPWQNSGFVKSLEICSAIFQNMKKVWKMEMKSGKIVESLECFSFFSFWWNLIQFLWYVCSLSSVMKKAFLFLRFLRSLLINDLFDNFESGKRNYCFVKKSGKSLEYIFWYMCKAKKAHLGISESKAGMLERTEKNCYQACLHWFLGELRCERRRLEI